MTALAEPSKRVGIDALFLQTYRARFDNLSWRGVASFVTGNSPSPYETITSTTAARIRPRLRETETKEMVVTVDSVLQLGGRRVGRLMLIPIPTQPVVAAAAAILKMILFGSDHAGSTNITSSTSSTSVKWRFFHQMRPKRFRCKCWSRRIL